MEQLQLPDYLSNIGFSQEETRLAITQIISRAVYPASELETARWIRENSAVCELTGYPVTKITKDKLYKSSLKLFSEKGQYRTFSVGQDKSTKSRIINKVGKIRLELCVK